MANNNNKCVRIIPLGGIGEIGKNMTALEYNNDIIIIDAGISFPTEETPGIDMIMPDMTYILQNKHRVKALIVTHGHEDHIGAIPFLLRDIKTPVYGSKLTIAFIEHKLKEHNLPIDNLNIVQDQEKIKIGHISIEFIKVSHSISGAFSLLINTPIGAIYHTGDFKIDYTPVDGDMINLAKIGELGKKGVLLLMADSTNIERNGYTLSERNVGLAFERIFSNNHKRRIIIATFSSNIHRIQQIFDAAVNHGRKVILSGRSLIKNIEIAHRIGELSYREDLIVDISMINNYPKENIVILSTGSQGEPMSALTRMAKGDFNKIKIQETDTVIISAAPIPGNERAVYSVINNLYRKGAEVIYESLEDIHVSGHACKEELKLIHSLIKPKFFVPVHGEYRHLKQHAILAETLGMTKKNIVIPNIGYVIELRANSISINGKVASGTTFIDGITVGETDDMVLSDRKKMSGDGIILLITELNDNNADNVDVLARGIMISEELCNDIKEKVYDTVKKFDYSGIDDRNELKRVIRRNIKRTLWSKLNKAPMIIPFIMED